VTSLLCFDLHVTSLRSTHVVVNTEMSCDLQQRAVTQCIDDLQHLDGLVEKDATQVLYLASTHVEKDSVNERALRALEAKGAVVMHLWARILCTNPNVTLTSVQRQMYLSRGLTKKNRTKPSYTKLAIGSRVMLNQNLLTTHGLVNGCRGTVVGFLYPAEAVADMDASITDIARAAARDYVLPTGETM
jgi:hypothetical protein